jgi:hypothetical protein
MQALPQEFLVCQDVVDGSCKAAQTFGFNPMVGFHVAEALGRLCDKPRNVLRNRGGLISVKWYRQQTL